MPPSETREKSMAAYGNGVNFFGGSLFDTSCIANNDHDLDQFVKERMCACVDGWMWWGEAVVMMIDHRQLTGPKLYSEFPLSLSPRRLFSNKLKNRQMCPLSSYRTFGSTFLSSWLSYGKNIFGFFFIQTIRPFLISVSFLFPLFLVPYLLDSCSHLQLHSSWPALSNPLNILPLMSRIIANHSTISLTSSLNFENCVIFIPPTPTPRPPLLPQNSSSSLALMILPPLVSCSHLLESQPSLPIGCAIVCRIMSFLRATRVA